MKAKKKKKRNAYGSVKQAVYEGCINNMSAREIHEKTGISMYTIYSTARVYLNMKTRQVRVIRAKEVV
jgi:hypothetical protein